MVIAFHNLEEIILLIHVFNRYKDFKGLGIKLLIITHPSNLAHIPILL
jgi:hypothetical protein